MSHVPECRIGLVALCTAENKVWIDVPSDRHLLAHLVSSHFLSPLDAFQMLFHSSLTLVAAYGHPQLNRNPSWSVIHVIFSVVKRAALLHPERSFSSRPSWTEDLIHGTWWFGVVIILWPVVLWYSVVSPVIIVWPPLVAFVEHPRRFLPHRLVIGKPAIVPKTWLLHRPIILLIEIITAPPWIGVVHVVVSSHGRTCCS
jgi:hypothetical protein